MNQDIVGVLYTLLVMVWMSNIFVALVLLVLDGWHLHVVVAISPIATYDSTFALANGQTSTLRTLTFTSTELSPSGTFTIGDYNIQITVLPVRFQFQYAAVASGPASVTTHVNTVCSVTNVATFNTLQAEMEADLENVFVEPNGRRLLAVSPIIADDQRWWKPNPSSSLYPSSSSSSSRQTMRKLKIIDFIALGIGITALYRADLALSKIQTLDNQLVVMSGQIGELQTFAVESRNALNILGGAIATTAETITVTNQRVDNIVNSLNNTVQVIEILREQTDSKFATINQQIAQTQADVAAAFAAVGAQAQENIQNVWFQLSNFTTQYGVDQLSITNQIEQLNELVVSLASEIFDLPAKAQVRRQLIQLYFQDVANLQGNRVPVVSDAGIAPQSMNGAPLVGIQSRLAMDIIAFNYVATGTPGLYGITNQQFNWYLSSDYAIDHATSVPQSISSFFKDIGSNVNCSRPYPTGVDVNGISTCSMWIEIVDSSCTSTNPFDWTNTTQNPANPNPQTTINNTWCTSSIISTTTVIKSFNDLFNYIENACNVPKSTYSQISSSRMNVYGKILSAMNTCSMAYSDMITAANAGASPLLFITTLAYTSYGQIDDAVADLETVRSGRLPSGLDIQSEPWVTLPTRYTESGEPIRDGSAQTVECLKAIWLDATTDTVDVMSITPFLPLTTQSVFAIVSNPGAPCTDQALCYPIGQQNVTTNILSNIDAPNLIPSELLVVGDIRDVGTTNRIYDLPQRLLSVSPSLAARKGAFPYLISPPGSTRTITLSDFLSRYGELYDPTDGGVSPDDFSLPAAFDIEGFPYCAPFLPDVFNLSAVLSPAGYTLVNASTRCMTGYTWSATPVTTTLLSACLTPLSLTLIPNDGTDYTNELTSTQWAGVLNDGTLSHWYQKDGRIGDNGQYTVLQLTANSGTDVVTFSVSPLGIPTVIRVAGGTTIFDSTSFYGPRALDLRDGTWHLVTWTMNEIGGFVYIALYVDAILLVQSAGQPEFPSLQSTYTPNITASNAGLQSQYTQVVGITVSSGTIPSQSQVQTLYLCQQSSLTARCEATTNEVLYSPILQNTTIPSSTSSTATPTSIVDFKTCSQSALTLYTSSIEASIGGGFRDRALLPVDWLNEVEYSLSFWLRQGAFGSGTQTVFTLSNQISNIMVTQNAGQFNFYVNSATMQLLITDDSSHFFLLYVNITTTELWMDGILFVVSPQVNLTGPTSPYTTTFSFTSDRLFTVRYYTLTLGDVGVFGYILPPYSITDGSNRGAQIKNEMSCEDRVISSRESTNAASYLAPIGYCVTTMTVSTFAYCRTPFMPHYSVLSMIDVSTDTFVSTSTLVCDVGFSPPDCNTPCPRVDPVSGECLLLGDDFSSIPGRYASGLIPDGVWCQILRFFKVAVNSAGTILTLEPRQWTLQATISIPLGLIVQNAATTNQCPTIVINQLQTGQLQLLFTNDASIDLYLQISIAPQTVIDGTAACLQPCCTLGSPSVLVAGARGSGSILIPTCGAMVITYGIQVDPANPTNVLFCDTISGSSLQAALAQSTQSLPVNVVNSIAQVYASNDVAFRQLEASFLTNFYLMQQQINSSNTAYLQAIAAQIAALNAQILVSPNYTQVQGLNYTASNAQIDALLNQTLANIQNDISAQQQINTLQGTLQEQLAALQAALAALNAINFTYNNYTGLGQYNPDCFDNLATFLSCGAEAAAAAAQAVIDGAGSLVSQLKDLGFGSWSNWFADLISFIVNFLIVAIILGVIIGTIYLCCQCGGFTAIANKTRETFARANAKAKAKTPLQSAATGWLGPDVDSFDSTLAMSQSTYKPHTSSTFYEPVAVAANDNALLYGISTRHAGKARSYLV
jgi:hypothetical protein